MGFCLPLASHCAVLTAPNSWAIPSSLAFDGEEGCTAVSHATVVGENRAMQATMGCSGTVLPAKCRAALVAPVVEDGHGTRKDGHWTRRTGRV